MDTSKIVTHLLPSLLIQILPTIDKENVLSDIGRIYSWISFHLSKVSDVKFSILYFITLVIRGWKEKIYFDHFWGLTIKEVHVYSVLFNDIYCRIF